LDEILSPLAGDGGRRKIIGRIMGKLSLTSTEWIITNIRIAGALPVGRYLLYAISLFGTHLEGLEPLIVLKCREANLWLIQAGTTKLKFCGVVIKIVTPCIRNGTITATGILCLSTSARLD